MNFFLPVADDYQWHAARVAQYMLALRQGQWLPAWAPNLLHGFGYPVFTFIYPLPYLLAMPWYWLSGSAELAVAAVVLASWMVGATGIGLLIWRKYQAKWLSAAAALLWALAPYTLHNIFDRGALGEIVFWGVLPWVLLAWDKPKLSFRWLLGAVGTGSLLILSHNLSVMMLAPVLILWFAINIYKSESLFPLDFRKNLQIRDLTSGLLAAFLTVVLTAWYWIPMVAFSHLTIVRELPDVLGYASHFLTLRSARTWMALVTLPIVAIWLVRPRQLHRQTWLWLVVWLGALVMMTSISRPIYQLLPFLPVIQFPWRWLGVLTFATVMLLPSSKGMINKSLIGALCLASILFAATKIGQETWWRKDAIDWIEYPFSADVHDDHKPKSFDLHKNLAYPQALLLSDAATGDLREPLATEAAIVYRTGTRWEYELNLARPARVWQKTARFPGWQVAIDDNLVDLIEDERLPGRVGFDAMVGQSKVTSSFQTYWEMVQNLLSRSR